MPSEVDRHEGSVVTRAGQPRVTREQKLRDEIDATLAHLHSIASLNGIGPNLRYQDAFDQVSKVLLALVRYKIGTEVHGWQVEDWSWDGYDACFSFRLVSHAAMQKPRQPYYDTVPMMMSAPEKFVPSGDLDLELTRVIDVAMRYLLVQVAAERRAAELATAPELGDLP
jgi:hypothetical protein